MGTEAILARVVNNTEPASYLEALLPLGRCPPHHCLLDFEVEDLDFGPSCAPASDCDLRQGSLILKPPFLNQFELVDNSTNCISGE